MTTNRHCPTCSLWKGLEYFGRKGTCYSRDCLMCKAKREKHWREERISRTLRAAGCEAVDPPLQTFPGVDIDRIHYKLGKVKTTLRRSKSNYRLN